MSDRKSNPISISSECSKAWVYVWMLKSTRFCLPLCLSPLSAPTEEAELWSSTTTSTARPPLLRNKCVNI